MDKIFEITLKKPLSAVRKNIKPHIALLNKKYSKLKKKFKVVYAWDDTDNILEISSPEYQINTYLHFTKTKIVGYMEIPLLLRAVSWMYQDGIVKEVKNELHDFLDKI